MNPTRRDFFKITTVGGAAAAVFGFDLKPAFAQLRTLKIARASETRSTCPYCAVGCGTIIYTIGDRAKNVTAQVVHVEGDPDHPTNRGTLCPKGSSLQQEIMNERRLLKPLVRRPGATEWQEISWDDAINEIAAFEICSCPRNSWYPAAFERHLRRPIGFGVLREVSRKFRCTCLQQFSTLFSRSPSQVEPAVVRDDVFHVLRVSRQTG